VPILSMFARLAGASGIHTGTAGVGKMAWNVSEDITAANQDIYMKAKWHFFDQSWATVSDVDIDIKDMLEDSLAHHRVLVDDSWRWIKTCTPIISGGLNPTKLKPFIDAMWHTNFITTMWAGVHAHPGWTKKGAMALVQSCEAFKAWVSIYEYAKDHVELADAIDFFENKPHDVRICESEEKTV
jgi:ribulose-bisphosphate carboxylase large chain